LDVVERYIGRGDPAQPRPGVYAIQELLNLIGVIFCHARTVDNIVDVFRERLALALEFLKLDGGDKLEGLTECGGSGTVERHR
jgi:hypothetical protein